MVWVEVELVLWPVSFCLDKVIANTLDDAVWAFNLTAHHPIIEMPGLL